MSNQVQFSLARPGPLDDLVPYAHRENRVVIAYGPLAQALLGGRYTVDNRPSGVRAANPLFGTENLRRVAPLLDTLWQGADGHGVKPAQAALAWLLGLPHVVVIPVASSVEQFEFNVAAADIQLDPESQAALTEAARATCAPRRNDSTSTWRQSSRPASRWWPGPPRHTTSWSSAEDRTLGVCAGPFGHAMSVRVLPPRVQHVPKRAFRLPRGARSDNGDESAALAISVR